MVPATDPAERSLTVDGRRVGYLAAGDGPPVVLLHGGGLDRAALSWKFALPALADEFAVYAPDLPGYGDSDPPDGPATTDSYVDFAGSFLDALDLESAAVVGLSLGGGVALGLALRSPERVDRLVLVDSMGLGGSVPGGQLATPFATFGPLVHGSWWLLRQSRLLTRFAVAAVVGAGNATPDLVSEVHAVLQRPGAWEVWNDFQRHELAGGRLQTNYEDRLQDLAVPTLLVHGEADRLVPAEWATRAGSRIPDAEVQVLPGVGHWPPREVPERFVELVADFLGQ